jgi:hypothetical protein
MKQCAHETHSDRIVHYGNRHVFCVQRQRWRWNDDTGCACHASSHGPIGTSIGTIGTSIIGTGEFADDCPIHDPNAWNANRLCCSQRLRSV